MTFHPETGIGIHNRHGKILLYERYRAELEITACLYSSRLDEAVCSHPLEAKVQQSSII
jgi:hypothetical protein